MESIKKAITFFGSRLKMAEVLNIRYDMITKYMAHIRFPSKKLAQLIENKTHGSVTEFEILNEKFQIKYNQYLKQHGKKDI